MERTQYTGAPSGQYSGAPSGYYLQDNVFPQSYGAVVQRDVTGFTNYPSYAPAELSYMSVPPMPPPAQEYGYSSFQHPPNPTLSYTPQITPYLDYQEQNRYSQYEQQIYPAQYEKKLPLPTANQYTHQQAYQHPHQQQPTQQQSHHQSLKHDTFSSHALLPNPSFQRPFPPADRNNFNARYDRQERQDRNSRQERSFTQPVTQQVQPSQRKVPFNPQTAYPPRQTQRETKFDVLKRKSFSSNSEGEKRNEKRGKVRHDNDRVSSVPLTPVPVINYDCKLCNAKLNSVAQVTDHEAGAKHIKTVKQHETTTTSTPENPNLNSSIITDTLSEDVGPRRDFDAADGGVAFGRWKRTIERKIILSGQHFLHSGLNYLFD